MAAGRRSIRPVVRPRRPLPPRSRAGGPGGRRGSRPVPGLRSHDGRGLRGRLPAGAWGRLDSLRDERLGGSDHGARRVEGGRLAHACNVGGHQARRPRGHRRGAGRASGAPRGIPAAGDSCGRALPFLSGLEICHDAGRSGIGVREAEDRRHSKAGPAVHRREGAGRCSCEPRRPGPGPPLHEGPLRGRSPVRRRHRARRAPHARVRRRLIRKEVPPPTGNGTRARGVPPPGAPQRRGIFLRRPSGCQLRPPACLPTCLLRSLRAA
mmetsp:Transcript_25418/g.79811  ORF Transcript_25418/g.79811 Transcript_25418/m.79811 type:complete len:266 (-) Transcript_25418:326-1123(-)